MEYQNITYEQKGRIAVMAINRPDKRNALNMASRKEIADVLDRLADDLSVSVLIVTGVGDRAFIAGSDLNELSRMSPLQVHQFANTYGQQLYHRLTKLDIPVIAMINGLCLGGGLEVAMACDIRIASETAKLGQPEIFLGITPGSGATQRLPRLIGQGRAREMIFSGQSIPAEEAERIGLVNRVVPAERLETETIALAEQIAAQGRAALGLAKRAMNMADEIGLSAGLAYESLAQAAVFTSPDREEGMTAFFEKRRAEFHKNNK